MFLVFLFVLLKVDIGKLCAFLRGKARPKDEQIVLRGSRGALEKGHNLALLEVGPWRSLCLS